MTSVNQKKKARLIATISVLSLIVIAALCFVFGYAMSEGWEVVGAWFTSKYATLTIIAVVFVVVAVIFFYFFKKDKEDFR